MGIVLTPRPLLVLERSRPSPVIGLKLSQTFEQVACLAWIVSVCHDAGGFSKEVNVNTFGPSARFDLLVNVLGLSAAVDAVVWRLYHQASSGVQAYVPLRRSTAVGTNHPRVKPDPRSLSHQGYHHHQRLVLHKSKNSQQGQHPQDSVSSTSSFIH